MFFLFGINPVTKKLGQKFQVCSRCKKETAHNFERKWPWFTLFFIPIVPIGRKRVLGHCNLCGQELEISDNMINSVSLSDNMMKCPECAELIQIEANVCRFCGHRLSKEEIKVSKEKVRISLENSKQQSINKSLKRKAKRNSIIAWIITIIISILFIGIIGAYFDTSNMSNKMTLSGAIIGLIILVVIPGFCAWSLFKKAKNIKNMH
jgi:hypothetical protein